jgi:hypothetical protein
LQGLSASPQERLGTRPTTKRVVRDSSLASGGTGAPPKEEAPPERAPVAQPAPAASTTPAPGPSSTPASSPAPAASPTPQPAPSAVAAAEPQGSAFTFSVDRYSGSSCARCLPDRVVSESVRPAGTSALTFRQESEGTSTFKGTGAYGLDLKHQAEGRAHEMTFILFTPEGTYIYTGSGLQSTSGDTPWGGRSFKYEGTYRLGTRPSRAETVPETGRYSLVVEYSPKQGRLVSTSFFLTEAN